jgi:hypothetical protein
MSDLMQAARVAAKLESALQTMKRLLGDKWEERATPYRTALQGIMATDGCSVLDAALPVAKRMTAAGESPVMLLAVAAEMASQNMILTNSEANDKHED